MKRIEFSHRRAGAAVVAWVVLTGWVSAAAAGERWTDGPEAERVLGQVDFVSSDEGTGEDDRLDSPWGIAIDPVSGKVFVAEPGQHRVVRFASYLSLVNGAAAEVVLGQPGFGPGIAGLSATAMSSPQGVACDDEGRLWVSDSGNARVLRFDDAATLASGAAASGVIGQADFISNGQVTSASGMRLPRGLAVDGAGNLFVADVTSCRVVMYPDAANLGNGGAGTIVFGQTNETSFSAGLARNRMNSPNDVAIDVAGTLYVADRGNHRILRFDDAALFSTGVQASAVLGQPNYVTNATATSATGFNGPAALDLDPDGHLWVVDAGNQRALRFESPVTLDGAVPAAGVVGQPDFTTSGFAVAADRMVLPQGIAVDPVGRIYVTDFGANRVVVFVKDRHFPDLTIGEKLSSQRGENLRNLSGAGQKKSVTTDKKEVKFLMRVGNDGNVPDEYRVSGLRGGSKSTHRYFSLSGGKVNLTAAVVSGAHLTGTLAPGGIRTYELRMKPKGKNRDQRITVKAWFQGISTTDGEGDRVLGEMKNRP